MPLNLTKVLKGYPRRRQYIRWQVDTTAVPPDRGDLLLSENPLLSVWQPGRSGFSPPHSAPPVVGIFAGFPVPNHRRICEVEVETNSLFVGHMPTLPPTHDTFPDGTPTPMSPPPPYEADTGFAFNDVCHSQQSYSSMQVNAGSVDESFQSGCDQSAFTDTYAITQMKAWPRSGDDSPDDTHYY
ncbi:uncharacterized protein EI90DRAFT_3051100 [Cantharellus anzutake]|uniref:uncharacterized protein n=1 Tax=Cantharellus anzutake TaxID=1750568 RepID=UPI001907DC45|nr:uncharacterized protein EI90DRAFT_3051100 [Cantharellus anzutake]KAF8334116.1 hypothetical protein EI90DRAFT_3051100 [Cantharellus anzutake]